MIRDVGTLPTSAYSSKERTSNKMVCGSGFSACARTSSIVASQLADGSFAVKTASAGASISVLSWIPAVWMASKPPSTTLTFWWPNMNRLQRRREAPILLASYARTNVSLEIPLLPITFSIFFWLVSIFFTGTLITMSAVGILTAPATCPAAYSSGVRVSTTTTLDCSA